MFSASGCYANDQRVANKPTLWLAFSDEICVSVPDYRISNPCRIRTKHPAMEKIDWAAFSSHRSYSSHDGEGLKPLRRSRNIALMLAAATTTCCCAA